MPFKDTPDGQTHYVGDGCKPPHTMPTTKEKNNMKINYFTITETKQKTSEIIQEMKEKFDVYCWCSMDKLDKDFPAPTEITTRYVKKNIEADEELKNKSADDLKKKGIKGITLRERLLLEIQYFDETSKHLDVENVTLCSGSRYSDDGVPRVRWRTGDRKVGVGWYSPSGSDSSLRARAVVSNPFDFTLEPLAKSNVKKKVEALIEALVELKKAL